MLEMTDDYLAVEGPLVELLETVDGIRKVYTSVDMAELKQRSQTTPAAHVIYGGGTPVRTAPGGVISHDEQTWYIVLAVSLLRKEEAGKLLANLIKALAGHHTSLGPLIRQNPPRPTFSGGFGYYPLAYNIKFRVRGVLT